VRFGIDILAEISLMFLTLENSPSPFSMLDLPAVRPPPRASRLTSPLTVVAGYGAGAAGTLVESRPAAHRKFHPAIDFGWLRVNAQAHAS
jgi:hypothetical protein